MCPHLQLIHSDNVYQPVRRHIFDSAGRIQNLKIQAMSTFYQVAGGGEHTLIALDTGDVFSCGKGSHGQLGNATIEEIRDTTSIPSNVSIPERIKSFNDVIVASVGVYVVHLSNDKHKTDSNKNSICHSVTSDV